MVLSLLSNKTTRNSKRTPASLSSSASSTTASSSSKSIRAATSGTSTSVQLSPTASSTLAEALRSNPFAASPRPNCTTTTATTAPATEILTTSTDIEDEKHRELRELNDALNVLARLFPDVQPEVFRELLTRFDGKSRLEVSVEQLLRYRSEWVKGRWNVSAAPEGADISPATGNDPEARDKLVPREELFRSGQYKDAVRAALAAEFRSLSRSAINAVLAEGNFSYTRARPTLLDLSRKSWRVALGNMFSFKKKKAPHKDDPPPYLVWQRRSTDEPEPVLKGTGCAELDEEIYNTYILPLLNRNRETQIEQDSKKAKDLNELEAKAVDALYECDCCLSDVTFEQISTCSESSHIICFSCIQRTLQEALFGQGWDKSINPGKSTLLCIAPFANGTCQGALDAELVKRAILQERSGMEIYRKFEARLASESLAKSSLKLIHCPFCSYAEVDPVFHPSVKGITWQFRKASLATSVLVFILLLDIVQFFLLPLLLLLCISPSTLRTTFRRSLQNVCLRRRSPRFKCGNPLCSRASCMRCHKVWNDPHTCHEPLLQSLRTTVEAARTAAIKRTCPCCGLSFVKSSGCNKLTCVCGYSMCYICRKALGPKSRQRPNGGGIRLMDGTADAESDNDEVGEEAEGYKHFCEHFRILPGASCTECNKCDLYQTEDEEAVAQRAGEKAQQEWRIRQGMEDSLEDTPVTGAAGTSAKGNSPGVNPNGMARVYDWDLQFDVTNGSKKFGWKFWTRDLWQNQRWKIELQLLIDNAVDTLIVVDAM
ncbi:TRIAD3 protein [Nannizzia gypsea CBS 118893]|uniref:TRIAD3 protein n=1 Tax=Arthroderma gypseum (strain ATCC MYA-4604 / CBS 118893) TaxID=535722 RepID=E4V684_ARTGP|nr:TRIAD3 protein [Nannizzia gypsea CBS 118893]EFR05267.1 TRIAD3 protein [Nannizzia gypsea CBS 118893]